MQNSLIVDPPLSPLRGGRDLLSDLGDAFPAQIAWFLDFDGSLVDLAPRPEDIVVPPGLTARLLRLRDASGGALAIITGRERGFVLDRLGTDALEVVGLHGAEEVDQPLPFPPEAALAPVRAYAQTVPGIIAEDKGAAFALHYRLAPDRAEEARAVMATAARSAGPEFRLRAGKAVWELCPARADKGAALLRLMARAPFMGRRPIAVGDDLTDEAMFGAANRLGGFSVFVGAPRTTAAGYRLAAPEDLRALLKELMP